MAGLMDMFGGGDGSLYGDLLTPQQQQALALRGLQGFLGGMQKSGALDYTAPFISGKVPAGFAAGLAGGVAGMGEAQDAAGMNALRAVMLSQQAENLKSQIELRKAFLQPDPGLDAALKALAGGGGSPQTFNNPVAASTGGGDQGGQTPSLASGGIEPTLDLIEKTESNGKNVPNYKFGPGFTAQGNFQITNSTWRQFAPEAGVSLGLFPTAMSAPYEVQRQVARTILTSPNGGGIQHWSNYNQNLRAALAGQGGQGQPVQLASASGGSDASPEPLPAVPDFTGMMAGNQGPSYAPAPSAPSPAAPFKAYSTIAEAQRAHPGEAIHKAPGGGYINENDFPYDPQTGASVNNPPPIAVPALVKAAQTIAATAPAAPTVPAAPQPAAVAPSFGSLAPANTALAQQVLLGLARKDAQAAAMGLGNPYQGLIGVVQGMPNYKGAVTSAEEAAREPFLRGRAEQGAQLDIAKAGPIAQAQQAAQLEREATIARLNQQLDIGKAAPIAQAQQQANADNTMTTVTVNGQKIPMTVSMAARFVNGQVGQPGGVPAAAGVSGATPVPAQQGAVGGAPPVTLGEQVLTPAEQEMAKGLGEDFVKRRGLAYDAQQTITNNHESRRLLDAGIYTGTPGAMLTELANKFPGLAGKTIAETAANSRAFVAQRAQQVATTIKNFGAGTGLSDADRQYAAMMSAADPSSLSETSIRRMFDIEEKLARNRINQFNQSASRVNPSISGGVPIAVEMPAEYSAAKGAALPPGVPAGASQIGTYGGKPVYQMPDGSRKVLQ